MKLYLDSFVYDLIQRRSEAAAVRAWRKENRHEIGFSIDGNIVEALRNPSRVEAERRVKTITTVATAIHPPFDFRHYKEIADELERLRPSWFREPLDRKRIAHYLKKRKHEALVLKEPSTIPDLSDRLDLIRHMVGIDVGRQKQHRRRPNFGADWMPAHGDSAVQACMNQLARPDAFWRYVSAEESRAAIRGELHRGGHLEWLVDLRWPVDVNDWDRFWMCDADSTRLPLCRISGLAELYQREQQPTFGNPLDRAGHSKHIYGFDFVVTTDAPFAKVLEGVRGEMPDVPLARVAVIDSEAPSALAAIARAVTN